MPHKHAVTMVTLKRTMLMRLAVIQSMLAFALTLTYSSHLKLQLILVMIDITEAKEILATSLFLAIREQ